MCEEIIGARFFGSMDNSRKRINTSFKSLSFTFDGFEQFILSIQDDDVKYVEKDKSYTLEVEHDDSGFIHIKKYNIINYKDIKSDKLLWDIVIHKDMKDSVVNKLIEMRDYILEEGNKDDLKR